MPRASASSSARRPSTLRTFDDDSIPPPIRLLLDSNLIRAASPADYARRLRSLLPELQRQAEWSRANFEYFTPDSVPKGMFLATASGGLNPLAVEGDCSSAPCKANAALNLARTLGLYADIVLMPDMPTTCLVHWRGDQNDLTAIANQHLVLKVLEPMIRAGIIRFWSGTVAVCKGCLAQLHRSYESAARSLLRDSGWTPAAEIEHGVASLDVEPLYGQSLILSATVPTSMRRGNTKTIARTMGRRMYLAAAAQAIHSALIDLRFSDEAHASLFSTRRQPLLALKAFDFAAPELNQVAAWESARSIQLPWVSDLSVQQVITLRQEAKSALPAFRNTFVQKLMTPNPAPKGVADAIANLREDAATLHAELNATQQGRERAFRGVYGTLGMSFAVYAAATGNLDPSIGLGLLAVLGYLHSGGLKAHKAKALATASPAYVLVKAKELLEHAA